MLILVHSPLPHPYYRTTSRNCFHCCILSIENSLMIERDLWNLLEISNQVIFYSFKMLTLPSSSLTTLTLGTLILSHTPCLITSFVITSHLSYWPTSSSSSSSSSLSYLQLAAQLSQLHARLKPYLLRREKEVVEKSVPPKEEVTPLVLWDCIYYPPSSSLFHHLPLVISCHLPLFTPLSMTLLPLIALYWPGHHRCGTDSTSETILSSHLRNEHVLSLQGMYQYSFLFLFPIALGL